MNNFSKIFSLKIATSGRHTNDGEPPCKSMQFFAAYSYLFTNVALTTPSRVREKTTILHTVYNLIGYE